MGTRLLPPSPLAGATPFRAVGRHFSFPVEIGAAYTGTPQFALNVAGNGCASSPCSAANSSPVTGLPGFTTDLNNQITKIKNDLKPARFYPILNTGVAYRF